MFRVPLILLLAFCSLSANAQQLFNLKTISGSENDVILDMARDSQGNTYYALASNWYYDATEVFGTTYQYGEFGTLVKVGPDGLVKWVSRRYSQSGQLAITGNDILYVYDPSYGNLDRVNTDDGTSIVGNYIPYIKHMKGDALGNLYIAGVNFVAKLNIERVEEWRIYFNTHGASEGGYLDVDLDGNIILGGDFYNGLSIGDYLKEIESEHSQGFLAKLTPQGQVLWVQFLGDGSGSVNVRDVKSDFDGSVYFTGRYSHSPVIHPNVARLSSKGGYDWFIGKLDSSGEIKWVRADGSYGYDCGSELYVAEDHLYATATLSGNIKLDNAQVGFIVGLSGIVSRFDKGSGKAEWIRAVGSHQSGSENYFPYNVERIDSKSFTVSGSFVGELTDESTTVYSRRYDVFSVTVIDTLVNSINTVSVKGKVYPVKNGSCDSSQPGMPNIVIKAMPGPVYTMSNASGEYTLNLSPGTTYTISQILPKKIGLSIAQTCPIANPQVQIKTIDDKPANVNFGNTVVYTPYLTVDVATDRFRRCFRNDLNILYTNEGMLEANNVEVKVKLPEHIIPISSSIPWSSNDGKEITFKIPSVAPGFRGYITVTDSVRCGDESIRGLTRCVTATITPHNSEETNPLWDKSEISLTSRCLDNGFLRLTVKNTGVGAMSDSAVFKIYADDKIAYQTKYKLASNDSISLQLPANGKTIRLEAYTTLHSPKSMVSVSVEGCGTGTATISHGFINAFYQSDEEEEFEIFCGEILDSYDPNDKQVFPTGITANHNIVGDEELEYLVRFQNTGTDVAYNIVIRDGLTDLFDLSTLKIGAASHPYSVKLEGEGEPELVWTFKNIMLPHAEANEKGSHGYVKFKVKLKKDLPKGTVVRNNARIYFDYNSPIITNEVFNTIGLPEIQPVQVTIQDCKKSQMVEAGPDEELMVCDQNAVTISAGADQGYGTWQIVGGNGVIASAGSVINISALGEGLNNFKYSVVYCDASDTRVVKINRIITPAPPTVQSQYNYCADQLANAEIDLSGNNLVWYDDASLATELKKGNKFNPESTGVVYVTDQVESCKSAPSVVKIIVNPSPFAPEALPASACVNTPVALSAMGTDIKWYSSVDASQPSYTGNNITPSFKTPGEYVLFVASTMNGCESSRVPVDIKIRGFALDDMFIPDLFTPNGDFVNEYFELPEENFGNCAGNFQKVVVYNRFGKTLYSSTEPGFRWSAADVPDGVYFYVVSFDAYKFEGSISVRR